MGWKGESGDIRCYLRPRGWRGCRGDKRDGTIGRGGTTIIQELKEGKHPEKATGKEQSVRWEEHKERVGCGSQEKKEF